MGDKENHQLDGDVEPPMYGRYQRHIHPAKCPGTDHVKHAFREICLLQHNITHQPWLLSGNWLVKIVDETMSYRRSRVRYMS